MNVCMVTSTYPRFAGDGTGRFIERLAEALVELGHEVHVWAPYDSLTTPVESYQKAVVHRFRYVWPDSLSLMGHARALYRDVKVKPLVYALVPFYSISCLAHVFHFSHTHRVDILHSQWVLPSGSLAALVSRTTGTPLMVSLHGSDIFMAESNPVYTHLARIAFDTATIVTSCSQDLLDRAIKLGLDPAKGQVIPYGVDLDRFAVDKAGGMEWRRRLGLSADDLVVAGLGRLVDKKGFTYLVQAMPTVCRAFPNAHFVIGGQGPLTTELQHRASETGVADRLHLPGHVEWNEVPGYMNMADVFVMPSIHDEAGNVDGLPNVVLEAMASSLPIVASNVAGLPAVVHEGENGFLVPERQPDALARALNLLLSQPDLRNRFGQASRRRAETELGWEAIARRYVSGYQRALAQRKE